MKASQIAARLTGFSTPFFGASWTPPTVDVDVARKVITFVEDRRVLFSTYTNEVPEQCAASVIEIRKFLTDVIGAGGIADRLEGPLRAIRGYCRNFLDAVGASEATVKDAAERRLFDRPRWGMQDAQFALALALGELRAGVGLQVGIIAATFKLDVKEDLAAMIPADAD
jgi:hypothetical protein